jgi:glycerate kinase
MVLFCHLLPKWPPNRGRASFASQFQFSRCFSETVRRPPGEVRRRLQHGERPPSAALPPDVMPRVSWQANRSQDLVSALYAPRSTLYAPCPMRTVVIAPDKFKGSLTAEEAAEAMARGVRAVWPDARIIKAPMADGGEGTLRALVRATGGRVFHRRVMGPLGEPVRAAFGVLGDGKTAVIEMAEASGFKLVPAARRNPLLTTTYGTGELILSAMRRGCRRLIVGIGGSATNDGGAGMAQALGARLLDARGRELPRGVGGGVLNRVASIEFPKSEIRNPKSEILVAGDVRNPLVGPRGASAVFGPQKGATPAMVKRLDANLRHWARRIAECGLRNAEYRKLATFPGGGAAGGLGAGLKAFFGARFRPGVEIVIEHARLAEKLRGADLVITGEGRLDRSTLDGKAPLGVARLARRMGVPVIAVGGSLDVSATAAFRRAGFAAVAPLMTESVTLKEAMANAAKLLATATARTIRALDAAGRLG